MFYLLPSHPYNPLKSLTHEYTGSPTGEVTLTRSTVLALSGWSNTQFSYWVRRGEAISTLRDHDERLGALAFVLERRLRSDIGTETEVVHSNTSLSLEDRKSNSSDSSNSPPAPELVSSQKSSCVWPEDELVQGITGKGLDIIIDQVKKRSGASQFLRGKHSSLDPFGTICLENENRDAHLSAPIYMPTFQAMEYTHTLPPSDVPPPDTKGKRIGKAKPRTHRNSDQAPGPTSFGPEANPELAVAVPLTSAILDHRGVALPLSNSQTSVPTSFTATTMTPTLRPWRTAAMSPHKEIVQSSIQREHFPVSDSRSEFENVPRNLKRIGETAESPLKKRTRQRSQ